MAQASGEPGVPAGTGARLGIQFYDEPERDALAGWVAATLVCGPEAAAVEQSLFRHWDGALARPSAVTVSLPRFRRTRTSTLLLPFQFMTSPVIGAGQHFLLHRPFGQRFGMRQRVKLVARIQAVEFDLARALLKYAPVNAHINLARLDLRQQSLHVRHPTGDFLLRHPLEAPRF